MNSDQENNKQESKPSEGLSRRQIGTYLLSSLFLTLAVALCLVIAAQVTTRGYASFFGRSVFRVVTGSMEPTIPVNAVLLCKTTEINQIREGDIICYRSLEDSHPNFIITHRVVSIRQDENGAPLLETRGDANAVSDPLFVTGDNLVGRVEWYSGVNLFTGALSFMSGKIGFLTFIVLPVMLVGGLVLQSVAQNIHKEIQAIRLTLQSEEELNQPPSPDELLPGFQTITRADYDQIYAAVKQALLEELNRSDTSTD